ncbi:cytochrome b-c1 complex subunit 6, mitochondrial-like isoform X2 [Oratosquilla oratoria]|uniref:cytochrome b-c1 complex subunit 6, mitochondrial-like isoform X2 n=1 Tax=Oratosquilla oratoria TaxID=337810 RepID=UPI003F764E51
MGLNELEIRADDPEEEEEAEEEEEEEEEEDLVDPLDTIKSSCGESKSCTSLAEKLSTCNDRVNARSQTEETCEEELNDYMHCVDACLSKSIFKHLK